MISKIAENFFLLNPYFSHQPNYNETGIEWAKNHDRQLLESHFRKQNLGNFLRRQMEEKKHMEKIIINDDNEQAKWFKDEDKQYKRQELKKLIDQKKRFLDNAVKVKSQIEGNHELKVKEASLEKD